MGKGGCVSVRWLSVQRAAPRKALLLSVSWVVVLPGGLNVQCWLSNREWKWVEYVQ